MAKSPVIYGDAIKAMAESPSGFIAAELVRVADEIVVRDAEETLLWEFVGITVPVGSGNPPPGPPRYHSGQMFNKIRSIPPEVDNDGLVVGVITDPVNPESGEQYGRTLRDRDYHFLPDKYYED